jgi:multidrug efflux pump subunit AcrB
MVRIALSRPYTFVVLALLLLIIGPLAALRTPTDIFPDIRIPVIGVVWQYTGLPPDQMAGRITTPFQRALTTTVNDIEHIVANSYNGIGIVKIFFQPNVDIRTANAQVTAISQTLLKQMPPGRDAAADPQLQRLDRADHPGRAVRRGPDRAELADIGINQLRTPLVTVPGAAIPYPFGGKQRQVQIDLNPGALQARGLSGQDVANALAAQNLITPVGTQKIGGFEYTIQLNNSPLGWKSSATCRSRPSTARWSMSATSPGARRQSAADQHRARRRQPLGADDGAEGGRDLDARYHRRHQAEGDRRQGFAARQRSRSASSATSRCSSRRDRGRAMKA